MWTNVQFTGTLPAGASQRWFTFGWPASWHVVWYMMPTTVRNGAPEIDWDVAVERADANSCTYWITVKNLASVPVTFEGRYAVLN
ncbi:hypothetical protein ACWEOW_10220 [Monashia sp. NPDC004114]